MADNSFFFVLRLTRTDIYNSYYWYAYILQAITRKNSLIRFKGPKVNTIEKLAELRKAGVNVGV